MGKKLKFVVFDLYSQMECKLKPTVQKCTCCR